MCCENELPKERKKEKGAVQTMTLYYNTTIWLYKINLREEWRRKRERKWKIPARKKITYIVKYGYTKVHHMYIIVMEKNYTTEERKKKSNLKQDRQ